MSKSKQPGPALFDLLGPTQDDVNRSLRVPHAGTPHKAEPTAERTPTERLSSVTEQAIVPSRPDRLGSQPDRPAPSGRRRRLIQFDDECVQLSLTSVSAAVVVFVLLVGILAVYEFGRTNGLSSGYSTGYRAGRASFEADASSEIEAARHRPPASHLVEDLLQSSTGQAVAPLSAATDNTSLQPTTPWVQGHTYVVAQEFSAQAEHDAIEVKTYLEAEGIDTAMIKLDTGWFQLVTKQGFDRSDPVQRGLADRLLAKVHRIGKAYYTHGGRYKLEGYFKTLRNKSW